MTTKEKQELERKCLSFRRELIEVLHEKRTGHPGGSLSVCEILTTLYFHTARVDAGAPEDPNRDRIILSKGHAAPMLYLCLAEKGYFPKEEMHTLRDLDTRLQGHPSSCCTPGVDLTAGPLGLGLSAGVGMALGLRGDGSDARVYVVLGDGELDEGTVWEGAMSAAKFGVSNLTAVVDLNGVQLDGTTAQIMPMTRLRERFQSFGWNCLECDGHDVEALSAAFEQAAEEKERPTVILAHTVKGKGVSFMEGKNTWHGAPIDDASYAMAMAELEVQDG